MAKEKQGSIKDIIDKVSGTVNWEGLTVLVEDLYSVLKKDLPGVMKATASAQKSGCCDHGKCCDEAICHLVCALKCELAHKAACEAECDGDEE